MKKLSILFSLIFFLIIIQVSYAIPNPAAVYCKESGYNYKIVETEKGQKGVCVLPDKECDAWEFYSGECGIEYSSKYCAKRGYDRADKVNDGKNSFFPKYTVCVPKIAGQEKKSVTDLMELKKLLKTKEVATVTTTTVPTFKQTTAKASIVKQTTTTTVPTFKQTTTRTSTLKKISMDINNFFKVLLGIVSIPTSTPNPPTFDWRSATYKSISGNWMTSPKDQGTCGACWIFAPVGAMEAKINMVKGDPNLDYDISEQDVLSCSNDNNNCETGNIDIALNYLKNSGAVDESCFLYTAHDWIPGTPITSCSNKQISCPDWVNRVFKINNYASFINDIENIKSILRNEGPIIAFIDFTTGSFDGNGIYRCTNPSGNNHNVVIVGYKDTGDPQTSYWIAKNSWGIGWTNPPAEPPPKDGYFYIGFGQCNLYFSPYIGDVSTPGVCKIKYDGTCTSYSDCGFAAACHCQASGGPLSGYCNYPSADCCTSDRPKCCGMTSRTDDECTTDDYCRLAYLPNWFCNQGRGKKCCMDPWFYTTYCGSCTGTVGLKTYVTSRYSPFPTRESSYATVGETITFKNYINSFVGDCSGIKFSIKRDSCSGQQVCSCNLSPNFEYSGAYGCSCKIKAPVVTCPESNPDCYMDYYRHIRGRFNYYSCVDFDGDGYETNEQTKVTLIVDSTMVPLNLLDSIVQFFNNLFGIKG